VDRCALFVDASYVLGDGAMAVHGTRNRDSVSWDYAGVLHVLRNVARDRTGLPLLRCYWYEATVEGRRTAEHEALADLSGVKLRLGRMRPGRREGVESEIHRDLTTLARNQAISDALVVSAEEDLAQVISDVQDLGIRVILVHIPVGGTWTVSPALRQECDDVVDISEAQLRPTVELVVGAEPAGEDERHAVGAYAARVPANGHGPTGALGHRQALPVGSHAAPPAIYTGPVIAEYQRAAQPAVSQPAAAGNSSGLGGAVSPVAGHQGQDPALPGAGGRPGPGGLPGSPPAISAQPGAAQPGPVAQPGTPVPPGMPGLTPPGAAPGVPGQPGMAQPGPAGPPGTPAQPGPGAQAGLPGQLGLPSGMPGQPGMMPPGQAAAPGTAPGQPGIPGRPASPGRSAVHPSASVPMQAAPGLPQQGQPGPRITGHHAAHAAVGQPDSALSAGHGQHVLPQHAAPSPAQQGAPGMTQPYQAHAGAVGQQGQLPSGVGPSGVAQPGAPPYQAPPPTGAQLPPAGTPPGQVQPGPAGQAAAAVTVQPGQPVRGGAPRGFPQGPPGPHDQRPAQQFPAVPAGHPEGSAPGQYVTQQGPHSGPQPMAQHAPVPQPVAVSVADAVQAAHGEGFSFGQAVARDAPALWLEAVLARKPRMPSDLEARLLQDSSLPIDSLLHDEVRHALRRGFWDALERVRH
jgi:uncharacterized LabA/DUF88 family protein